MSLCIQDWLHNISWMMQGTIFSAIRGCDGTHREDPSKIVVRGLRTAVLLPAQDTGSFLANVPTWVELMEAMREVCLGPDHYPIHFLMHLAHAAEIIGYEHPDDSTRKCWKTFYQSLCRSFHMHPETRDEMHHRLADNPILVKEKMSLDNEIRLKAAYITTSCDYLQNLADVIRKGYTCIANFEEELRQAEQTIAELKRIIPDYSCAVRFRSIVQPPKGELGP